MPDEESRWLVLGARGTVGTALSKVSLPDEVKATFLGRTDCRVDNPRDVRGALEMYEPNLVINCAAWTDVNGAEHNRELAWRANSVGPAVVSGEISSSFPRTRLIHLSSDYVFGAVADSRSPRVESDSPSPMSVYGASKLAGERAVRHLLPDRSVIIRTSWIYGPSPTDFIGKMIAKALTGRAVEVPRDQWGSPTFVLDVAEAIEQVGRLAILPEPPTGLLHLANEGATSRFELARAVFEEVGVDVGLVKGVWTLPNPGFARRPHWSPLASERIALLGLKPLRNWSDALRHAIARYLADGAPQVAGVTSAP